MSVFNEILQKINEISQGFSDEIKNELQSSFAALEKAGDEYLNSKLKSKEKNKNGLTTLQSINEDDDVPEKKLESKSKPNDSTLKKDEQPIRSSKRSKDEMDATDDGQQDKRPKRNASVKAQGVISRQVNVNLMSKMRREEPNESTRASRRRNKNDDGSDKENSEPLVKVKEEKLSLPAEMDNDSIPLDINLKVEADKDEIAMPPPLAPVPRPRGRPKEKEKEESSEENGRPSRSTRTRKQTESMIPPAPAPRSTRASNRASSKNVTTEEVQQESRPKRTRGRKKKSNSTQEVENESKQENMTGSPVVEPKPKRTRKGQKAAEKQPEPEKESQAKLDVILKQERISNHEEVNISSPILTKVKTSQKSKKSIESINSTKSSKKSLEAKNVDNEETKIITNEMNVTVNICNDTVTLPNGKYCHSGTPKKATNINETVVLESRDARETIVLEKAKIMDSTVVLDKEPQQTNITDDNSLLTDDNSDSETPPKKIVSKQPVSAVKEKVQKFEEMVTRVTRTKTRAMAKKDDTTENQTPPDKVSKVILSVETLNKMDSLIFNGKLPQNTASETKLKANNTTSMKSMIPHSTSKLNGMSKHKEQAEEVTKNEKEDARKKKEAMLEAKKEAQKKKREDKMAAAAAAREAAERERQALLEAAEKDRREKHANVLAGREIKLKEAEKKKQELARKAAETEERRKLEERNRQQRLAEEQKKAELTRKKQFEEQEAMKKEAALMAKEIEKRQKEYIEKQKLKMKLEAINKNHTPIKSAPSSQDPVYMADGFEQLNSESEDEEAKSKFPVPQWSTSKVRWHQLTVQAEIKPSHIDRLFSVRIHSPDLREMFPNIDRRALKRTSSAVWRTPKH